MLRGELVTSGDIAISCRRRRRRHLVMSSSRGVVILSRRHFVTMSSCPIVYSKINYTEALASQLQL